MNRVIPVLLVCALLLAAAGCKKAQYTLTVTQTGPGTVAGSGTYEAGTVVQLTVTPDALHYFRQWTGPDAAHAILHEGVWQVAVTHDMSICGEFGDAPFVVQAAGGSGHSLAVAKTGKVYAWGSNFYGQLGDGTSADKDHPIQVPLPADAIAVSCGSSHSIVLIPGGYVYAFGDSSCGQLGNGSLTGSTTAVRVSDLAGIIAIAAGGYHSLALSSDGTVWAWGENSNGQLGDGTTVTRATPVQVQNPGGTGYLTGVVAIAAGDEFSLALTGAGAVYAWGGNDSGQLGNGTTSTAPQSRPALVKGVGGSGTLSGIVRVSAGYAHGLASNGGGTLYAWGYNGSGQLGDGSSTDRLSPVEVSGLSGVASLAGGVSHTLAVTAGGSLWGWGYNNYGQLGTGSMTPSLTPASASLPEGKPATQVFCGWYHSMATDGDGFLYSWGFNENGQLGDYSTDNHSSPIAVPWQVVLIPLPLP